MYWSLLLVFPVINVITTLLKTNINASMSTNILFINFILRSAILYYSISLKYFSTSYMLLRQMVYHFQSSSFDTSWNIASSALVITLNALTNLLKLSK